MTRLEHPFNNLDCASVGDGIDDTPATDTEMYGCYAIGEAIVSAPNLFFGQAMDYCDDACLYMFTEKIK